MSIVEKPYGLASLTETLEGSVVFPDADVRFYLDADVAERARRRWVEIGAKEESAREEIERAIELRDRKDSTRRDAPLRRVPGMIYVDTTGKTVEEVVGLLHRKVVETIS